MTKTSDAKSSPIRYVIIDTNIFQHFANPDLAEQINQNLSEAIEAGYQLALSDITLNMRWEALVIRLSRQQASLRVQ